MSLMRAVCGALVCVLILFKPSALYATDYKYDEAGRLIEVTYDSGRKVSYTYDLAGNRMEHKVDYSSEFSINDTVPIIGTGNNLINLSGWPVGEAPTGAAIIANWNDIYTFGNEARWSRVTGPGESRIVTGMEAGQTNPNEQGGGAAFTNYFAIDKTKAYEYTLYFRKHDLSVQSLYFGLTQSGQVRNMNGSAPNTNPYFVAWGTANQQAYLDANKWYKIVGYVFPTGYMGQSGDPTGGIYEVDSGIKVAGVSNYRWNEHNTATQAHARFFTYYYSEPGDLNKYTAHFYQPEVKVTNISYTPVVPNISATLSVIR